MASKVATVFSVPHSEAEYQRIVKILDELVDEVGEDEEHPLVNLMEMLGVIVEAYEEIHLPVVDTPSARESLQFLMVEHGLTPADLPEVGSQKVVSEILSGQRQLNVNQIKALSERFKVSPTVFI